MDSLDHQNAVFLLDFPGRVSNQLVYGCRNLTRLQRASKGSGQSTGGGRHDVIESGGVRRKSIRRDFVVLGDGAVNAENYRVGLGG